MEWRGACRLADAVHTQTPRANSAAREVTDGTTPCDRWPVCFRVHSSGILAPAIARPGYGGGHDQGARRKLDARFGHDTRRRDERTPDAAGDRKGHPTLRV